MKKCGLAFFLLALAACTRLGRVSSPAVVVWDEAHFCTFAKDILERKFYFDIHPPFGKLVQAGVLKLAGATTQDLDCAVGAPYLPNFSHWVPEKTDYPERGCRDLVPQKR